MAIRGRASSTPTVAGIDIEAVASWMSDNGLGAGPLERVTEIGGGTQNILLRFRRDSRPYVLRRGPLHLRPRSNVSILRETRVLGALAGTDVPHPRLIASCADPSVLGDAVFYLMEPIDGFNASVGLPELHSDSPEVRHEMGLQIVDALAKLGAVDHVTAGLSDFGKPEGFLERQVPRWLSELATYSSFENYPGPAIPGVQEVGDWLERERPSVWSPGIMHGDYHAANVMFSPYGPEVAAVVDWEMCTIGDPLLDLGWLLATWRLPGEEGIFGGGLMKSEGLATADELVARYAAQTTRDVSAITWYSVLACFKLGIVLEGSLARAYAGKATMEIGEQLHTTTLRLFERAQVLMNGAQ
jgi:aminoglycoside phosphotransferase (APT) family kinase protein